MSAPDLLKALENLLIECGEGHRSPQYRAIDLISRKTWDGAVQALKGFKAITAALTSNSVDAVPVAWQFRFKSDESEWLDCSELWAHMAAARTDCETRPLYAHPVPAKPDDYARGLSDGLRQAAEVAKYNMHLAMRDAILDLIPK